MATRYYSIIFIFLISSVSLFSQKFSFENYDFEDKKIVLTPEESNMDELMIFQNRKVELVIQGESVKQYFLLHQQVLVNSDRAIENNNKIYIGFSQNSKVVKNINRVILPNGKIIELNKKDIHEEVDEESGSKYQYYAVKGLEKGAIIEKLYILEENPRLSGSVYNFQNNYFVKQSNFQLIAPKHLIFKSKSYNGLSSAVLKEDAIEGSNILEVDTKNIKPISTDEKLSNVVAHKQKFRYKLYENTLSQVKNFYNYNDFAKRFFSNFENELTKKEKAALVKFLKYIAISNDEKANILKIENHIKRSISYNVQFTDNDSFEDIIKNKQGKLIDILALYRRTFDYLGIKSEFVFTSDRFDFPFDPEFETTSNIREILIYFPNTDQYLDATNPNLRSPLISFGSGNTNGIKVKEVSFGGATMATDEAVFIKLPDEKISSDTMSIDVDFTKDIENPFVKSRIVFGGYSGATFQSMKDYFSENQYVEVLENVAKSYSADVELESVEPKNDGIDFIGKNNFELNISLNSKNLMKKAGDKYLYEVGQLIGVQSELYQEDKRTMPVEMNYEHCYDREITLVLPDGYKISNPEILDFDFRLKSEEETTALFTSTYKIENNTVVITNKEFYSRTNYALTEFEDFRKVYSAASDFNKLVIVLEKK